MNSPFVAEVDAVAANDGKPWFVCHVKAWGRLVKAESRGRHKFTGGTNYRVYFALDAIGAYNPVLSQPCDGGEVYVDIRVLYGLNVRITRSYSTAA
jgi:hypothetical protein